jgi:cellulose synthase/poly-beta-1,6-N-acetylglucosamine synthase-like glycosyltransferase
VLDALVHQTADYREFEVVVVDDGSTDDTSDWLRGQTFPFQFHMIRQHNTGPSGSRNSGIASATGRVLIFIDDDLIPTPKLIEEHLRSHAAEGEIAVIGPAASLPRYLQPWIVWQQATYEKVYRDIAEGRLRPSFQHFWSGNCSVRRQDAIAVGGYDEQLRFGEDVEFGRRLMERGLRFRFNPAARGYHYSSRSLDSWVRACCAQGKFGGKVLGRLGDVEMHRVLAEEWRSRHRLTRGLVRWGARRPARTAAAVLALRGCIRMGMLAPASAFSRAACAGMANLLYWDGMAEALGWDQSLFSSLELPHPTSAGVGYNGVSGLPPQAASGGLRADRLGRRDVA